MVHQSSLSLLSKLLFVFLSTALGFILILPTSPSFAATIVVDEEVDDDPDVDNTKCSLREAVIAANTDADKDGCISGDPGADIITLPAGTYRLTREGSGDATSKIGDLDISDELTINGAGSATTIIDGAKDTNTDDDRVICFMGTPTGPLTINNVTIRNGKVVGAGGGLYNDTGGSQLAMFVNNSVIEDNEATETGGGIGSTGNTGPLTITDSLIQNNIGGSGSSFGGGGVGHIGDDPNSELTIIRSTITGNTATSANGSNGGGVFYRGSDSTLTIDDSTIADNTAVYVNDGGQGGGVYVTGAGDIVISGSTLSGNHADQDGGGMHIQGATSATVTNSTISGNTAATFGGGVRLEFTSLMNFVNATIVNNMASPAAGAGLFVDNSSTATLANTIIANNTPTAAGDCLNNGGTLTSNGNNIASDMTCFDGSNPSDQPDTDPELEALANNGGPTETHALMDSSPAIDNGENSNCPSNDQRGMARPVDGDDDGTATCDVGAFELSNCGDGVLQSPEVCDDGNDDNSDACLNTCVEASCGDGVVEAGADECDDGNNTDGDGCAANCTIEVTAACGDGTVDANEECDDGNNTNGDGCAADCTDETGGAGTGGGCSLSASHQSTSMASALILLVAMMGLMIRRRS